MKNVKNRKQTTITNNFYFEQQYKSSKKGYFLSKVYTKQNKNIIKYMAVKWAKVLIFSIFFINRIFLIVGLNEA